VSTLSNWGALLSSSRRDPAVLRHVLRSAKHRLWADDLAYGYRRPLDAPVAGGPASGLHVRLVRNEDVPAILEPEESMTLEERWDRSQRLSLLNAGAGSCFVAVTDDGTPCFVQWVFTKRDNEFVTRHFGGQFPPVDEETVLLEGLYVPTAFRNQRLAGPAVARVMAEAYALGARYVVTFIGADNIASLKTAERAGFGIYLERHVRWRLLRSTVTFREHEPAAA
jgi:RimJ/RimL family protein N-acetyltransferase